jgi:hypothetical protein
MHRGPYLAAAALLLALLAVSCTERPEPVTLADNTITVENQTSREWRNIVITVNDHFSGGAPSLAPKGRLNAPLSQFKTAYGQRFAIASQPVQKIEVSATDSNGAPVTLSWGGRQ